MQRGTYVCSQCLSKQTMMTTNKLMLRMLKSAFRIDCNECQRHWAIDEYTNHKARGKCQLDFKADNNIDSLS